MPGRTSAAKRYAEAVSAIARTENSWERWRNDLHAVGEVLKDDQLRLMLESPRISAERKNAALEQTIGGLISPEASNLLKVIGQRGRFNLMSDVITWFDELADRALNIHHYTVTTAVPLTEDERRRLSEKLAVEGGQVVLTEQVDANLLGGMVVRHEDIIRDYSLRTRLETLRARLN
jgi:F-type H+-transporting ATPase subunit delta